MDTPARDAVDLRPLLDQVRAAHRRQVPTYAQRMADLDRLAEAVRRHRDELAKTVSADFGRRSRHETLAADVMTTLDEITYLRRKLKGWMRPQRRGINLAFLPARGEIRPLPLGVIGIVAPWNYPIQLALIPLADAIAAGNHVLVKPSEHTPRTSQLLARILAEVFPPERVSVVQGDAAVGAAFTALPFDHLVFTGSTVVGRAVMAAAAPQPHAADAGTGRQVAGADRTGLPDRPGRRPHRRRQVLQRRPDLRGARLRAGAARPARRVRARLPGQRAQALPVAGRQPRLHRGGEPPPGQPPAGLDR